MKQRRFKAHPAYTGLIGQYLTGVPRYADGTPNKRAQAYLMKHRLGDVAVYQTIQRLERGETIKVMG